MSLGVCLKNCTSSKLRW